MKRISRLLLLPILVAAPLVCSAASPDTEAVEYYNTNNKHFFITATGSEASLIDAGAAGPGWVRTGRSFQAWIDKAKAAPDAQPVCRFYSSGANSHFYTASPSECALLKNLEAAERARTGTVRGWAYEGVAFHIQAPVNGVCPTGTEPITRVYNDGFRNGEGSNHRFVDDDELAELMAERSWIREGVALCAVTKATGSGANLRPTATSFEALVGTWKGDARWKKEIDDEDESRVIEPLQLAIAADGKVTGSGYGCAFTGQVQVGDGHRSFFRGAISASGCTDPAFNGPYERLKLERFGGKLLFVRMKHESHDTEVSIDALLTNTASTPPPATEGPFASVTGTSVGTVSWNAEEESDGHEREATFNKPITLTIGGDGRVTGSGFGCAITGQLVPRSGSDDDGDDDDEEHERGGFRGTIVLSGCTEAVFNGTYVEVSVRRVGPSRIAIRFERETETGGHEVEVEIRGVLTMS